MNTQMYIYIHTQTPVFGDSRDRVRRFCAAHRLPGHVQLNRRTCIVQGCTMKATYGVYAGVITKHEVCVRDVRCSDLRMFGACKVRMRQH